MHVGEFVEDLEPTHVGADLVAGSLIKNPGGTMAPSGGYVVGKARYVSAAFKRLSAPGVEGGEWILMKEMRMIMINFDEKYDDYYDFLDGNNGLCFF